MSQARTQRACVMHAVCMLRSWCTALAKVALGRETPHESTRLFTQHAGYTPHTIAHHITMHEECPYVKGDPTCVLNAKRDGMAPKPALFAHWHNQPRCLASALLLSVK